MGVPSFYRWLANNYPKIVVNAVEKAEEADGSLPNPNGREFDNLYLDMNGMIHPCFHPEYDDILLHQLNSPVTYEEVFSNIFEYIDRILQIVRPRKLLYMAIDGVAPRAKMNQQRTRRFRTAKDREILEKEEDRLRREYEIEGRDVLPKQESKVSDSNVITPGTEFMYELSKQLQTYIRGRISNNVAWKQLKVILSDANAPGEGEHKIMSFIRHQRTCPGYNPNTSHVLFGLDADLIMLALATHEIHFSILREDVLMEHNKTISSSGSSLSAKSEANVVKSRGWFKQFDLNQRLKDSAKQMGNLEISTDSRRKSLVKKPYQFLHVWILREYLELDMKMTNLPEKFETNFERIIDDFIFICFFSGNDFLPHMPTLEIHEGAIDLLMHVYKEEFKNLGGYLVDTHRVQDKKGGYIKLKRVERFILAVGAYEDKIFKKRSEIRQRRLRRILLDIENARANGEDEDSTEIISTYNQKGSAVGSDVQSLCSDKSPIDNVQIIENTKMLKEQLKSCTRGISDVFRNGLVTDWVNLGAPGWKQRYYKYKFSADTEEDMENMRKNVVEKYTEGLCWVLLYYFSGVPSWTWFFPYHYGPFASDMKGLSSVKVGFQRGLPFKPFDQLMAVLPPLSAHALPASYQSLMLDDDSNIHDFYPSEFDTDTDGKRFLWQGICKLPFIEEDRLLAATKKMEKDLSEEEVKRNVENIDRLFVHSSGNFASHITSICKHASPINQNHSIKIDSLSGDINVSVHPKSKNVRDSNGLANDHDILCVYYDPPSFCLHVPHLLDGTTIPETVVSVSEIEERPLWHDDQGYHGQSNRSYNQIQGAKSSPSAELRSSCPGVIIEGAGNCWRPNSRGKSHDFSRGYQTAACHDATRTLHEQTRGPSRWDAHGRGARGNEQSRYSPGRIGPPVNSGLEWSQKVVTQPPNYPGRTNSSNGHFWSASPGSGSNRQGNEPSRYMPGRTGPPVNSGLEWSRMVGTQPPNYPGRTNSSNEHFWSASTGSGSNRPGNEPSRYMPGRTGPSVNSGLEWSRKVVTQPPNYPGRTNSSNGQFWSASAGSGSNSNQGWNQWGKSRGSHGDSNSNRR